MKASNLSDAQKTFIIKQGEIGTRELIAGMCSYGSVSIRTAHRAIGFDRSPFHYKSPPN